MKILFCDWNGTIVDDVQVWDRARKGTFLHFNAEPPSIEEYFTEIETGDYLEVYRKRGITASREALNEVYEKLYIEKFKNIRLFPGVKTTLEQLNKREVHVVLVTTQPEELVVPLLNKFKIEGLFGRKFYHSIDKTLAIKQEIKNLKADSKSCFFVGDVASDMQYAKGAGVVSIGFTKGYSPPNILRATSAEYYIDSFEELLIII